MEVLHPDCSGLDVDKDSVVACIRHKVEGKITPHVKTFKMTLRDLMALPERLSTEAATHLAVEATGVYWMPIWQILPDGEFELSLHLDQIDAFDAAVARIGEEVNAKVELLRVAIEMLSSPGLGNLSARIRSCPKRHKITAAPFTLTAADNSSSAWSARW